MVELVAARDDVDTADMLTMAEAFQKCFIANGAKLRIVDFSTTMLTHADVATPNAFGDIITQTQAGGTANMVVDYVSSDHLTTYGFAYYTGSVTTFVVTTNVTGGTGSDFAPTAITATPHWRTWVVYPETAGSVTYGSMPTKAYLVCRYLQQYGDHLFANRL